MSRFNFIITQTLVGKKKGFRTISNFRFVSSITYFRDNNTVIDYLLFVLLWEILCFLYTCVMKVRESMKLHSDFTLNIQIVII